MCGAEEKSAFFWDVLSVLLLAVSVTMLTDFTRRMLGADPDSWGILSVSVQAVLAFAASSMFTDSGWSWIKGALGRLHRTEHHKGAWRFGAAAVLFSVVAPMWLLAPSQLSWHYNERAYKREGINLAESLRDYQRAISLDPKQQKPHVNLGEVFEGFYRYDDAAEQYREAIVADTSDPTPYNNLARVLLLDGKAATALRITNDALKLNASDPRVKAAKPALLKNRAWAEYLLGFYSQAIGDATKSNSAAGDCVLGKVYAKLGKTADMRSAWTTFNHRSSLEIASGPAVEPDCTLLAEDANEK